MSSILNGSKTLRRRAAGDDSVPTEEPAAEPEHGDAVAIDLAEAGADATDSAPAGPRRGALRRIVGYGVLPGLAVLLAVAAGYFKWQDSIARDDATARIESMQAAKDSTIALLSYQPNTVDQQLGAASNLLTGDFRNAYGQLIHDVVIPGAKQKQISAAASVPAVASVSANDKHSVALVYVNQTTVVGNDAPSASTSTIRVTMDKVNGRWLISEFDPV